jgi:hypothetical protein
MEYKNLLDIDPELSPSYDWRNGEMRRVERDVLIPRLQELGYETLSSWYSGESDSYGPLSRAINCRKDGVQYTVFYG